MKEEKSVLPQNEKPEAQSKFVRWITEPLSKRGWPSWLVYTFAVLGFLYILNPTAGLFEFIPDVVPFVGNLDEGVAFMLILAGLVEFFEGRKVKTAKPSSPQKQNGNAPDVVVVEENEPDEAEETDLSNLDV